MNYACPNCGGTGLNFSCPNHYWGINPLPDSIPMPQQTPINLTVMQVQAELFAEIGRLNVLLNERDKEIEVLRGERAAVVAWMNAEAERADCGHIEDLADRIERGEHRGEEA
jgi:hypothetical protein